MMYINNERAKELLMSCVEYIDGIVGNMSDSYDVLTNAVGFTESELDGLMHGEDDGECESVYCEDVTGVLGMMFANDMTGLPQEAVKHLAEAYRICADCFERKRVLGEG